MRFRSLGSQVAHWTGVFGFLVAVALAILAVASPTDQGPARAAASYNVFLPITMKGATLSSSTGTTSIDLINQALASGAINADTALTYKVYAEFHDTRLPSQYQGDDSLSTSEASVVLDLANKFAGLSKETQALLAPFIMPPAYVGSWYDSRHTAASKTGAQAVPGPDPIIQTGWNTLGDQNVRVWWHVPEDATKAATVATAIHDSIWPDLTGLMGRQPLSDQGPHPFTDLNGDPRNWGDGGDGRLDIYLIPDGVDGGGMAVAYPPGCDQRPAFIMIDSRGPGLLAAATHEFMHSILYSYDVAQACEKYDRLQEASATWAIDYVYPDDNWEHRENFCCQFKFPEHGLGYVYSSGYQEYIFQFYLSHKFAPGLVRTIWDNTSQYGALEAIDKAIQGGFMERFPDFAVYLWNRPPFNDFNLWDKISEVAFGLGLTPRPAESTDVVIPVNLNGAKDAEYVMPADVRYLASNYFHFTFPDQTARSVEFVNPYIAAVNPDARVQALVKMEGQNWVREDWTDKPMKTFCRDKKTERLEELVIILSNSDWQEGPPLDPVRDAKLVATNIGCWQWTGTARTTTYTQYATTDITDIVAAEGIRMERQRPPEAPEGNDAWELYSSKAEGTVNWSRTGSVSDCSYDGSASVAVKQNEGSLQTWNYVTSGTNYRYYHGVGTTPFVGTVTITCPEVGSFPNSFAIGGWFLAPALEPRQISADGITATGVLTSTDPGQTIVYQWDLHAQREP